MSVSSNPRRRILLKILLLLLLVGGLGLLIVRLRKYDASIGSYSMQEGEQQFLEGAHRNERAEEDGIPYLVYQVLPDLFPELFAVGPVDPYGLIRVPGRELPIGFVRTQQDGIGWVTHNCSLCHVASFRASEDSPPIIVLGAPAGYWREKYLGALETAFQRSDFTPDHVIATIKKRYSLSPAEEASYRKWIPQLTQRTVDHLHRVARKRSKQPPDGPGRMDALLIAKEMAYQVDEDFGTTDYAPLWNRKGRFDQNGHMVGHWDGFGQNFLGMVTASVLADGTRTCDFQIAPTKILAYYFMNLAAPAYPLGIDRTRASRGKEIFEPKCSACHAAGGARLNTVVPLDEVGTDPSRVNAARPLLLFTLNLFDFFQRYPAAQWKKSSGYRAELLDGLWARAPYLHNGSVPTVYDLLSKPEQRPVTFFRGSNVLDPEKLGLKTTAGATASTFLFDTRVLGNRNTGHEYGTDLTEDDKKALIEFLKTL